MPCLLLQNKLVIPLKFRILLPSGLKVRFFANPKLGLYHLMLMPVRAVTESLPCYCSCCSLAMYLPRMSNSMFTVLPTVMSQKLVLSCV